MPHKARVVVAGTGFAALREHLGRALPGVPVEAIEPEALRRDGAEASVLISAMARIDGQIMDRITGLRLIQQWGAGLEGVDLGAAAERHIAVANVPSAGTGNAASVAEWCVMAAIALSRRLPELERNIRQGRAWGSPIGRGLVGRTGGILGLGGIGQALTVRLKPFGMRLIGLNRHAEPALAEREVFSKRSPALQSFRGLIWTGQYRYVWSAAGLQAETSDGGLVCANVFGLQREFRSLTAMDSARSLPY